MASTTATTTATTMPRALPFGKHKGVPVDLVPANYLRWWIDNVPKERYSSELHTEILRQLRRDPGTTTSRPATDNAHEFGSYSTNASGQGIAAPPGWDEVQEARRALEQEKIRLEQQRQRFEAEKQAWSFERQRQYQQSVSAPAAPKLPVGIGIADILQVVSAGRKALAKQHHPDIGGDAVAMQKANQAADWLETFVRRMLGGGK